MVWARRSCAASFLSCLCDRTASGLRFAGLRNAAGRRGGRGAPAALGELIGVALDLPAEVPGRDRALTLRAALPHRGRALLPRAVHPLAATEAPGSGLEGAAGRRGGCRAP